MNPVDEALARAISTRKVDALADAASRLSPQFITDLDNFLKNEAENPSRWLDLAMGLGKAGLASASNRAFSEVLARVSLPRERAKVMMEWGRLEEAGGRILNAVGHYATAHRCDPGQEEALHKVKTLGQLYVPRIMLGQWDVFGALNDEAEFQRIVSRTRFSSAARDMLRNDFSRRWAMANSAASQVLGSPQECSFVVTKLAKPLLLVQCNARGDRNLACYEVPIVLAPADDADDDDLPIAYDLALNQIDAIARYVGTEQVDLEEPDLPILTPVSLFAAKRPSVSAHLERAFIDLTGAESDIWKGVRKGHKHAINWGEKSLEIRQWDGTDGALMADMMKLYDESGRSPSFSNADEVRPFWSGERGNLYVAYKDGQALAAVAINYEGDSAYYTASVSIDHGDVPGSHWPLYHAILKSKERGIKTFHFGYLETDESFDDKRRAIARFKSGFTEQSTRHIWWIVGIFNRVTAA